MEKSYNNWLALGVSILIMGIMLMTYSLTTYKQTKTLADKIDFQEVDNNTQMSTSDKYFKYLSYADYLNDELKKNKDLLIKNSTCNYVDYAQHNAISLYKLTYSGLQTDETRQNVAAGNIRSLLSMLDNYKTCKQTQNYKSELQNLLDDIQKTNQLHSQRDERMEAFMKIKEKPIDNTNDINTQNPQTYDDIPAEEDTTLEPPYPEEMQNN